MPTIKTITRAELADKLRAVKGTTFLTISAFTDARVVKKHRETKEPNPYPEVMKLSHVNGSVGADYEKAVNRQLVREGHDQLTFKAKDRQWGVNTGALIEDKGKLYLAFQVKSASKPVYLVKTPNGLLHVAKEKVAPYLPVEKDEGFAQGVERPIYVRNFGLDGIASITMNGETYRVRDHVMPTAKPKAPKLPASVGAPSCLGQWATERQHAYLHSRGIHPGLQGHLRAMSPTFLLYLSAYLLVGVKCALMVRLNGKTGWPGCIFGGLIWPVLAVASIGQSLVL